jgi:ankyrin repeat protein
MKRASVFLTTVGCAALCVSAATQQSDRLRDFWAACRNGDNAKVKEFLDAGLSPDAQFDAGVTPLLAAVSRGQLETVKLLVQRGASLSLRDDTFRLTPLGVAALFGATDIVNFLLAHSKEDLDVVLISGVRYGIPPMAEAGLKGNPPPPLLTRALLVAKRHPKPNPDIISMLEKAGAQPPPTLTAAQLQPFAGRYEDATKLELEVVIRDGKLIGTGGAGFEEFYEQELIPLAPDLLFLSSDPNTTFQFSGSGAHFDTAKIIVAGLIRPLQRIGGKS